MQRENILLFFAKYIETELGIVYADHNYYQLESRLEDIAKLIDIPDLAKLYEFAQKGLSGTFKQLLLDTATNNETSFFRDSKVFKAIESTVLPAFLARPSALKNDRLLIWSAASSTGQEALSLSILITERNKKVAQAIPYSITATDISERVLSRARSAEYSQLEVQRGLPSPFLVKYFRKGQEDRWTASKELTQNIQYQTANLKMPFPFSSSFFLVLCRNVLIYQSVEGKIEILNRITKILEPGGFLVLGSGESLLGLSSDYEHVNSEGVVIYRKKNPLAKTA